MLWTFAITPTVNIYFSSSVCFYQYKWSALSSQTHTCPSSDGNFSTAHSQPSLWNKLAFTTNHIFFQVEDMWSLLMWRNGNRIPAVFFRCSLPRLPSSQPNDSSVNSEGNVQNSSDSKDSPYAIWWHIGGNVMLYWMLLIWAEFHKLKYKTNVRWHVAGFACQLVSNRIRILFF